MTVSISPRFGAGVAGGRVEDDPLLRGAGCYTADVNARMQLHAVFLRSDCANARFTLDAAAARRCPGVRLVWTAEDVAGLGPMPLGASAAPAPGTTLHAPGYPLICAGRVRKVGDVIAMVVAETREQALDAADAIAVDYDHLAAVTDACAALADDAPLVWPELGSNLAFTSEIGDRAATDAAFAAARHIARVEVRHNRLVSNYMEPRAVLAEHDAATGTWVLTLPSQGVHVMRRAIAAAMHVPPEALRVLTRDVGGGFGPKYFAYRDYPLVALAARATGRPVKWVATRMEHFVADAHGRDAVVRAELAIGADGRVLGLRSDWTANLGAYMSQYGSHVAYLGASMSTGVYDIAAAHVTVRGAYTNTTPTDAYRGAGRPEAAYTIERLMDEGARVCGLDPVTFRKRNFIRPDQMPYRTATGRLYDSGAYAAQVDMALELADAAHFEARRRESAARGLLRGFGFATYVEACAFAGQEPARLRLRRDGTVELRIGTQASGQGHKTVYGQFVADALNIGLDRVDVRQGDTDELEDGGATAGSRSIPIGVPAVQRAAVALAAGLRDCAAGILDTTAARIDLDDGVLRAAGTNRAITFAELAERMGDDSRISSTGVFVQPDATYPNGTHVVEAEIDPATGQVAIVAMTVVDDFGRVINPLLLDGQVQGGIAQGLGQALLEQVVYDDTGQLLSASFMDYAMPRAADIPPIRLATHNVPCPWNEMGIKGGGEAGTIGATPAISSAILNALSRAYGVTTLDLPATPCRIWQAIRSAQARTG